MGNAEHPVVSRTKTEREERGRGRRGKGAGEENGRKEGLKEGGKGRGEGEIDYFNPGHVQLLHFLHPLVGSFIEL